MYILPICLKIYIKKKKKKKNSVEVVPHFWYDSSTSLCAWLAENLSYCVENKVTPDNKKFKYFKARVFKGCEKIGELRLIFFNL